MISKKKIWFILPRLASIGGVQKVIQQRCHFLAKDFDFFLSVTNEKKPTNPAYFFDMSEVFIEFSAHSPKKNLFAWILKIRKSFKLIKPDVIVVLDNGNKGLLIPWILFGSKVYYERHGAIHFDGNRKWYYPFKVGFYYLMALKFHKIFFLNPSMSSKWLHPHKIVIENGTMIPYDHADLSCKNILWIGRESVEKGMDDLFAIWQEVKNLHTDWNLFIYTPKPIENFGWLDEIKEGRVTNFSGKNNLNEIYLSGSVLIQTSHYEGFGLTILEAMSFGLPVISWDCEDGPRHLIANQKSGFLIPVKYVKCYVEKLSELISNETLRNEMGFFGKEISRQFDMKHIYEKWKTIYGKS